MDRFVLGKGQPSALDHGHHDIVVVVATLNYCALSFAPLNLQVMTRNVARLGYDSNVIILEQHIERRRRVGRMSGQKNRR